ncbi:MAG: 4-phosphoerythronate dehydrogenase [Lentisphaerota bacterium]
MKIVCASSVLFGREAFQTLGETVVLPDSAIRASDLKDVDALIVRSKTPIKEALLENTKVCFVGTATAGTDHMDLDYLDHMMIAWCAAPGCNANSVSEYVTSALLCLVQRHGLELAGRKIGVVGLGQVGSRVLVKAEALGMKALRNDPPLQLVTKDPEFLPLEYLLQDSDIITLHVPLATKGPFPTWHMADCRFFARMKPGCIFINASRGECVVSDDLLHAMEHGVVARAIMDVWENEPSIPVELLKKADLGTPHIAGYSFEGRLNGTLEVYRQACHFFEVEPTWNPEVDESLFPKAPQVTIDARGKSDEAVLWELVRKVYNIEADDQALRSGPLDDENAFGKHFENLRKSYAARREFSAVQVKLLNEDPELLEKAASLGFRIAAF